MTNQHEGKPTTENAAFAEKNNSRRVGLGPPIKASDIHEANE